MATVASLSGSQAEATHALDALVHSPFADVETRVLEPPAGAPGTPDALGTVGLVGNNRRLAVLFPDVIDWDLDEETEEFFARGLQNGGVLVVADVDDEQAGALAAFLQAHGGRTAAAD